MICGKAAKGELTGLGGASFYPHLACDGWSFRSPRGSHDELKDGWWALGWQEQRPGPLVMSLNHLTSSGQLVCGLFYLREKQTFMKSLLLFVFKPHAAEPNP